MNINEIKEFLETNKENQEVIDFINSVQQPLTRSKVEEWTKEGEGRSWRDSVCDIYSTKAVNTARENAIAKFKEEELPKLIDEAVKAKTNVNLTPEQIEIKELKEKMAKMEADKEQAEKLNANTQLLKEKNMPIELAKYINDEEDITNFENIINSAVQKAIDEKLGKHRETPPKGGTPTQKMSLEEIMAYANEHPGANIQDLINQNR